MSDAVARYLERFEAAAPALPGGDLDWLAAARRDAIGSFGRIGFPKPREEDWKYTRVAPIERHDFQPAPPHTTPVAIDGLRLRAALDDGGEAGPGTVREEPRGAAREIAHEVIFVDGHHRPDLGRGGALPAGVTLQSLADALAGGGEALRPYLAPAERPAHGFLALNAAFASAGVVLRVGEGVTLDAPLHLLFVSSGAADHVAHPRLVVECAPGSAATVFEHYAATGDSACFTNVVTQARLAERSSLTHYKLQRESTRAFHVSTLSVHQGAESSFRSHSVSLGAALSRHDINVALDGPGARCTLDGLYLAGGRQHVDYHTRIDHAKPGCTSNEDYRGILDGRARGVFNGRVWVHPGAQKTDASQSNRNLLLSRNAEVDTKPQLEIYADDVKCAHGATVGQLDERMVFYLRARGLDEAAARTLLTYGFARDLVDRIEDGPVREMVATAVLDRLPGGDELRSMLS